MAAIADELFVPYAEPGSKTEALCKKWIEKGKTVRTFESKDTKNLFELGASNITLQECTEFQKMTGKCDMKTFTEFLKKRKAKKGGRR
ncbi:hypothetical protein MNBD_NITROSPIRAE03-505 [hydrothermal vent metagenome]|uniref:Uncharacterized protein n=1 Tax=hydrothermal vent metagenome TaxID=652676 RepID=A0A3B1D252_9ZZZZ